MKNLSLLMIVLAVFLCGCGSEQPVEKQVSNEPLYYIESPEFGYMVYEDHVELKEFFGSGSETVKIPEVLYDSQAKVDKPLTKILSYAFNADSGARYLVIPDSVTEIGSGAFSECSGIETLTLGKNLKKIESGAFSGCTGIREIVIPDSVEYIGNFAFSKCATAVSVSLGRGVTQIGDNAFDGCLSAENITGGEALKIVGMDAFKGCPWFDKLSHEFSGIGTVLLKYNGTQTDVEIPKSFKSVSNAFDGSYITKVTFPKGFETIGNNAFAGCSALTDVIIPDSVSYIGSCSFEGTPYLENLSSDDGFCVVGDGVLLKYTGDSSGLMIPDTVKFISDAFAGNQTLSEVRIGKNVETIGMDAFKKCPDLTLVIMSPSVKHINEYAFYGSDILEFDSEGNSYAKQWAEDYGLKNVK